MNPLVLDLIIKGLESLPTLFDAGVNIWTRVEQIKGLAQAEKDGTLTKADIAAVRAKFDADIEEFNKPIEG